MPFLDRYFEGLPPNIRQALTHRLEEIIILIYGRHDKSLRDHSINLFTKEEISGMIHGVLDLAERLRNDLNKIPDDI